MLTVQRLGAMLAPATFLLADGRQASPMHIAPWSSDQEAETLPGILRKLRGEWPCVPFGYSVPAEGWPEAWARVMTPPGPDEEVHGHSSNHEWNWRDSESGSISLALDYPAGSPVERVERTITPDSSAPAIDIEFKIVVRRACRLPIGLHPVFRLPFETGAATLELGSFNEGRTYPHEIEPGAGLFAQNKFFTDLSHVPARAGGVTNASQLPLVADTEELLQIEGVDGTAGLANYADGYRVKLSWQKEHFPSLLLWYSNRGRKAAPWNGRHVAIGIEPLLTFRPRPSDRAGRQPDRVIWRYDGAGVLAGRSIRDSLSHRGIDAVTDRRSVSKIKSNRPRFTDVAGLAAMVDTLPRSIGPSLVDEPARGAK